MMVSDTACRCIRFALLVALLFSPALVAAAELTAEVDAVAGNPFGVAKITLEAPPGTNLQHPGLEGFVLSEQDGRLLYPAFADEPVRGLLRGLLKLPPRRMTAYFLFTGNEPLKLLILSPPDGTPSSVETRRDERAHGRLLDAWWQSYTAQPALGGLLGDKPEGPPQVKDYLAAMLSQRLNLTLPPVAGSWFDQPEVDDSLGILLGAESVRLQMQRDTLLGRRAEAEAADQPLPEPIRLPRSTPQPAADEVAVEPIALHVPAECFYVRFGSYANFQWLRSFTTRTGGDMRNLLAVRGINYGLNARMERQLVLKSSALGDLLGGLVISDVAMIGTDPFLREGAAMGVLFEARNSMLLKSNLSSQRTAMLKQEPTASREKLQIAGQEVELLSTPDNGIRSFYAIDGSYHLVTTSRAIVERFFAAGQGERALGGSAEFLSVRQEMPLERQDTVFCYFSSDFLEHLISPRYRIEMQRRLQAAGDVELVYLAALAASAEKSPAETIEQLSAGRFLPRRFGHRADGSRTLYQDGKAYDSLRGGRGTFLPIPDVVVEAATPSELEDYQRLAEYTHGNVQHLEPLVAGIRRTVPGGDRPEHVAIDLRASPFADSQFAFLAQWISGQPDQQRLAPVPGDLLALEAMVGGRHVFAGLRDCNPLRFLGGSSRNVADVIIGTVLTPPTDHLVGYLGAARDARALSLLGEFSFGPPDAAGYSKNNGLVWRRDYGSYAVLSFHRNVLETVAPQLRFEPAQRPAHARLRVGDLRQSQLSEMLDSLGAGRAESTTAGNERLLNSLVEQMHVKPEEALVVAEQVLGARLVCPLGGEYRLQRPEGGIIPSWTSDASRVDGAYRFPLLDWFRGLEADLLLEGTVVQAHIELDMLPVAPGGTPFPVEDVPPPPPADGAR